MPELQEAHVGEYEIDREKKARNFLTELKSKSDELLPRISDLSQGLENQDLSEINLADQIKAWSHQIMEAHRFLCNNGFSDFLDHDFGNDSLTAIGNLNLIGMFLEGGKNKKSEVRAEKFLLAWDRYWVVLEDLLLRSVSHDKVGTEFVGEIELEIVERLFDFFQKKEIKKLLKKENYKNIENVNFLDETDWLELKKKLEGKKIKGNNGLVDNFIMNAWRNALRDRTGATDVITSIRVEEDELVINVMDNGIGINREALDPDDKSCIFNEGESGSGSSGLGLTDVNKRIESAGARLSVVSKRGEEVDEMRQINSYPATEESMPDPVHTLAVINVDRERHQKPKVNTIFEIRIPLEDK